MIKAVVFDVDGTLLDTREYIIKSFEHSLAAHGHTVPSRDVIRTSIAGRILEDCYKLLAPSGSVETLRDTHRAFQKKRYDLIAAYEGLRELLNTLRSRGILSGIYSSRKETVRASLEHVQVLKYFDAVIDGGDVLKHKPDPEGVLKVLDLLQVRPNDAAMIGDTSADILAGKAAQCVMTIGVTHGLGSKDSLENVDADYIVSNLYEIPPLLNI